MNRFGRSAPGKSRRHKKHAHIRRCLVEHLGAERKCVRILYGGSVNPSNARAILSLPEAGGALVGGASLKPGIRGDLRQRSGGGRDSSRRIGEKARACRLAHLREFRAPIRTT